MSKTELFLGPFGIIIFGILVLVAVIGVARKRIRGADMTSVDGIESESPGVGDRPSAQPAIYRDFQTCLERDLLVRRQSNPNWERLDGAYDVRGRIVAKFMRDGTAYGINGETTFEAIENLSKWMEANPGKDPFSNVNGSGARGRLMARPELGMTAVKGLQIETV